MFKLVFKAVTIFFVKEKQIHGFITLHEWSINEEMNGITVRNTQIGGTSQFHKKARVKNKTSCRSIQNTKAIIIATNFWPTVLSCWSRWPWWQDSCSLLFLNLTFKVHIIIVPYTTAKIMCVNCNGDDPCTHNAPQTDSRWDKFWYQWENDSNKAFPWYTQHTFDGNNKRIIG